MAEGTAEASQRLAARIAGFTLLLLMISGLTGMFIFDRHLVVAGDAAATALNILAHERGFRAGQVCGILMLNCDVVLALALYGLLKPVHPPQPLMLPIFNNLLAAVTDDLECHCKTNPMAQRQVLEAPTLHLYPQ